MGLQEKLAQLKQEKEQNIQLKQQEQFDQDLAPVRGTIKKLEDEKRMLVLIEQSLNQQSGENTGKGMKEYAEDKKTTASKEDIKIAKLFEENKDVLEDLSVTSKEEMIENEDFAEEPEVLSYKQSKEQVSQLVESDEALKSKLIELGVEVGDNFSYDVAEKAITEKITQIDQTLVEEKLKTPEGKKEAVEMIAQTLEKKLPSMYVYKDDEKNYFQVRFNENKYSQITVKNGETKFEGWNTSNIAFLPKEMQKLEETYGIDVVKDAVKKAYDTSLEKSIKNYDAQNDGSYFLQQQLESANPKEGDKAQITMRDFETLQNNVRQALQEKSEELKLKGIEFDSKYASGYGGEYEDFIELGYSHTAEEIKDALQDTNAFPPQFDFIKLQKAIEKQKNKLQQFFDAIQNIHTQEDVHNFLGRSRTGADAVISKVRLDLDRLNTYDLKFKLSESPQTNRGSANNYGKTPLEKLKENKRYSDAESFLQKKISNLDSLKEEVGSKIELAVEARTKQRELQEEMQDQKFGRSIDNIESEVSRLKQNKKDALILMTEIVRLESELPQEPVVLTSGEVRVTSVGKQLEQLKKDREVEEQNFKNLQQKIANQESSKPKLFGIEKWEKSLNDLKEEQKNLEDKIRKMGNEDYSALYAKYTYRIPTSQYSDIEKLVKEQNYVQGTPAEVFTDLKAKLKEMLDAKAPESVMSLYKEYKDLEKKLS